MMLHKFIMTFQNTADKELPLGADSPPAHKSAQYNLEPDFTIHSQKTPWMGNGFAYFTQSLDETFIQYVALPFPDDKTRHFLHRFNMTQKKDGALFVSHTNNNVEKRDRLYKKRYMHCAEFDTNGDLVQLKCITPRRVDNIQNNPDMFVKNLLTEACFILENAQNAVAQHAIHQGNENTYDIIPQAEKMLETLRKTHRGDHFYISS